MRKCLRCNTEMEEGYVLLDGGHGYQVKLGKPGRFFAKEVSRLQAAVCPRCGYTELYTENLDQEKE